MWIRLAVIVLLSVTSLHGQKWTCGKAFGEKKTCTCVPKGYCVGRLNLSGEEESTATPAISNEITNITACTLSPDLELCCAYGDYQCGRRYAPVKGTPPRYSTYAGEYPWQVLILDENDKEVGGGVLIDTLHALTVAHKVADYTDEQVLKVRLGEWEIGSKREPIQFQEHFVSKVTLHENYKNKTKSNDLAILRLAKPVPLGQTPTIATACLTSQLITNKRCYVSGWGKIDFRAKDRARVLQRVDVPLVNQKTCEEQLRKTILGKFFILNRESFICAGGETAKDACDGDGGSPLVCELNGRWYAVGLVAWGIGCGETNVPGVYVNLASYTDWIKTQISLPNEDDGIQLRSLT